ncbi:MULTISPECIES: hypothetical protein [Enterobacteriaceae]|uniref:YdeA protein n=1 Tax=Citrobacter telavivensis TaxID=2653932 RepID=A0A6L5EFD6_9ENTR|nr:MULTISPECIES: hypothetical protein [Enterobacteriaceae]MPQ54189.1 hypothetical protein [Citrobacter telavivensis]HDR2614799.1 hypothetical protein [Enterobacter ludwigii]KLV70752.1 hypothetical protein SK37_05002 [Citrobacter sp. MGH109]MDT7093096.1 hypothetical protein [Citrobacter freundii]QFS69015.1 hypothetical protein GBC03_01745 [Citrobacter telavivensis]
MTTVKARRPSPLQRRILIVLAALAERCPGPVATRDIEQILANGSERPVYGNNLRDSCRRMENAGWIRTLRTRNLHLHVELTAAGRELAAPLLATEQERMLAEQRATAVCVLPLVPAGTAEDAGTPGADRPVQLDGSWHMACRGDYVLRLDGTTCLQLWNAAGQLTRLAGDPLQVATWLQACHDAGIVVRMQINESHTPEEGEPAGTATTDLTDTWYRQLDAALQAEGITGLNEEIRQAVIMPGEALRDLPAPARLLRVLRESPEAFPLSAAAYEEDTEAALADLLERAGFTGGQAQELQMHRIRWPLMSQEEYDRHDLNSLLDELERRQLFCKRDQLVALVFSPVRKAGENWTERLQWLLSTDGFGFHSPLSRENATPALNYLAGYVGQDAVKQLTTYVVWAGDKQAGKP